MNLRKDNVSTLFIKLFIPTFLGMLFSSLFIIIDGMIVGKALGAESFASVNLVAPLYVLMTGIALMFGTGGSILASTCLGKGQYVRARIYSSHSIYGSVLVTIIFSVLVLLCGDNVIKIIGTPEAFTPLVKEYLSTISIFFVFNVFMIVGLFVVRLDGAPNVAASSQIVAAILNIGLDLLFIFVFKWGLFGAALATGIAQMVGSIIILYYLVYRAKKLTLQKISIKIKAIIFFVQKISRRIVSVGASPFAGEVAISVMIVVSNFAFRWQYGDDGVVAFSIISTTFPLVYLTFMAVIQSAQPIISYNYACGEKQRVQQATNLAILVSICFGIVMCLGTLVFDKQIISLFLSTETQGYRLAQQGFAWFSCGFVFVGLNITIIGYIQSIGKATLSNWLTLFRGGLMMMFCYAVVPLLMPRQGVWLAVPIAELVSFIVIIVVYKKARWK